MARIYVHKPIEYITNEQGCHICTSHARDKDGYPFMSINGHLRFVARYTWEQTRGEIPADYHIRRSCGDRGCINPDHFTLLAHVPRPTPEPRQVRTPEERFWSRVNKTDDDTSCWEWTGGIRCGYGAIRVGREIIGTHRYSYTIHYGPIPTGLLVCHKCNNRLCVRPDHLYAGTYLDNYNDAVRAGTAPDIQVLRGYVGRGACGLKGSAHPHSILTEEQVIDILRRIQSGETYRAVAARYGVGKTTISDICSGKNWSWFTQR